MKRQKSLKDSIAHQPILVIDQQEDKKDRKTERQKGKKDRKTACLPVLENRRNYNYFSE